MKTHRLHTVAIILLLLLNLGTIGYMLLSGIIQNNGRRPHKPMHEKITRDLALDDRQHELYMASVHRHRYSMDSLDEKMDGLLKFYFGLLADSNSNTLRDSLENDFARMDREKLAITYRHFGELYSLLNHEQQQKFSRILPYIIAVMTGPSRKNHPPPKED